MKKFGMFVAIVFVAVQVFGVEFEGKTQPAAGHTAVISPICTQTTFLAADAKVSLGEKVEQGQALIVMREPPGVIKARELDIQLAEAELKNVEGALDIAQKDFKRASQLLPLKALAQSEFDLFESKHETAKQDVVVAQRKLACAQQALVLTETPLRAPIAGIVVSLSVRPGESAGPGRGQTIWAEILDLSVVDVAFKTTDVSALDFKIGENAEVVCNRDHFSGKVVYVSPILDEKEMTTVLVRVSEAKGKIPINKKVAVQFISR